MDNQRLQEITSIIELSLVLGDLKKDNQVKDEYIKRSSEEQLAQCKQWHKEDCERAAEMLYSYNITDYEKFAKLIGKCNTAFLLSMLSGDIEMSSELIRRFVVDDASSCLEYKGQRVAL